MGSFVSLYNYIGYRLLGPPFGLRQSAVGALSVLYLLGIFSSVWAGRLADRLGRRNVLWLVMSVMLAGLLLTLLGSLAVVSASACTPSAFSPRTRSPAAGWAGARGRRRRWPRRCTCSSTTSARAWSAGWRAGLGAAAAGPAWWPAGAILGGAMLIALRLRGLAPLKCTHKSRACA
jgi:YNFM family putative membrane transporter